MKKSLFLSLFALLLVATGCKKEVESVKVMPGSIILSVGETYQLQSVVKPDKAPQEVRWMSSDLEVATVSSDGKVTAVKAGTSTITVTTEDGGKAATCAVTVKSGLPEGALPGEFSVSATKKVHFSKGNLQAHFVDRNGVLYSWGFADNQYDFVGNAAGNTTIDSPTRREVIDLFGWSTSTTNFGICTSTDESDYSGDFVDWGNSKWIGDGSTWRTLSTEEWQYLININGNENIRKNKYKYGVTVCEKANCLILAPDDFEGTIAASYDAAAWATAEATGLVCLPAAGDRYGSNVFNVGGRGYYWSSSAPGEDYAYNVYFNGYNFLPDDYGLRNYGFSVRLITECQ